VLLDHCLAGPHDDSCGVSADQPGIADGPAQVCLCKDNQFVVGPARWTCADSVSASAEHRCECGQPLTPTRSSLIPGRAETSEPGLVQQRLPHADHEPLVVQRLRVRPCGHDRDLEVRRIESPTCRQTAQIPTASRAHIGSRSAINRPARLTKVTMRKPLVRRQLVRRLRLSGAIRQQIERCRRRQRAPIQWLGSFMLDHVEQITRHGLLVDQLQPGSPFDARQPPKPDVSMPTADNPLPQWTWTTGRGLNSG
jgi:hypothetical protein